MMKTNVTARNVSHFWKFTSRSTGSGDPHVLNISGLIYPVVSPGTPKSGSANRTLGFIRSSIKTKMPKIRETVYNTLVRPQLESEQRYTLLSICCAFQVHYVLLFLWLWCAHQDQDQDSLLAKRRNDNHSPVPVIGELVPSSHQKWT